MGRFGGKYVGMIFLLWHPALAGFLIFDESAADVHTLGTGFLPSSVSESASSSVTDVPRKKPDVLCCPEGPAEPLLIQFTLRYVFHQV